MCVGLWIALMSINGLRRTSNRERRRLRWSFKTKGISGQTDKITVDLGEILWGILDQPLLK